MLVVSFFWSLTGHTYVETLEDGIKLWIGLSKSAMLAPYSAGELDDVDTVLAAIRHMQIGANTKPCCMR